MTDKLWFPKGAGRWTLREPAYPGEPGGVKEIPKHYWAKKLARSSRKAKLTTGSAAPAAVIRPTVQTFRARGMKKPIILTGPMSDREDTLKRWAESEGIENPSIENLR